MASCNLDLRLRALEAAPGGDSPPAPSGLQLCASSSAKENRGKSWKKGEGLFTNAGGEVAAARAPAGKSSGADAQSEQPVCE